jgi:hypothetical protein
MRGGNHSYFAAGENFHIAKNFSVVESAKILYMKGIVHGNYGVEIYLHLLDLTRNSCGKCNFLFRSLTGIEPVKFNG